MDSTSILVSLGQACYNARQALDEMPETFSAYEQMAYLCGFLDAMYAAIRDERDKAEAEFARLEAESKADAL